MKIGFRFLSNFFERKQLPVMLGYDAQAGGSTVFGVGLFVEGEISLHKVKC
jgi:hypothetical protein